MIWYRRAIFVFSGCFVVIGTPRKSLTRSQRAVFGLTVDYVLRHAPCRVMVTASRDPVSA